MANEIWCLWTPKKRFLEGLFENNIGFFYCIQNVGFQFTEYPADDPRDFSGTLDHSEPERTAGGGREVLSECIQVLIQPSELPDF